MWKELYFLLTIFGVLTIVECRIRCFECQDMPTPHDCENAIDCSDGDECFLDQFVTASGYILFNQGCRSQRMCIAAKRRQIDVKRASTDVSTCEECCSGSLCNNKGCGVTAPPRNSRGPYCYSCDSQSGEDRCRTIKQCAIDEACLIRNTTERTATNGMLEFETGCIYIPQCHSLELTFIPETTHTSGLSVVDQCPFCCRDDYCNDNCNHNVTVTPTAAPVDGQWSDWSVWSSCTVSCDSGEKTRTRLCNNPAPQHNGKPCVGDNFDFITCSDQHCAVDGHWSQWSSWSSCSVTCGHGSVSRHRSCDHPAPQHGGHTCVGNSSVSQSCNTHVLCTVDGHWSQWSSWSSCSVTCGHGSVSRHRSCDHPAPQHGGHTCVGNRSVSQSCNTHVLCTVNGGWSHWSTWVTCSAHCGDGTRTKTRRCDHPSPSHGGSDCTGLAESSQLCNIRDCNMYEWNEWSKWSACQRTCGHSVRTRTRACGGSGDFSTSHYRCQGNYFENDRASCIGPACPVNGHWNYWGHWSSCAVTCGAANQTRSRQCYPPQHGGHPCIGENTVTKACQNVDCPVNGQWSDWSSWGRCTVSCGVGTISRSRQCTNPRPSNGGHSCGTHSVDRRPCSMDPCAAIDGGWGSWHQWTTCSATCGTSASKTRYRVCNHPAPHYGGANCVGIHSDVHNCHLAACPPNPCERGFQYEPTIGCYKYMWQASTYDNAKTNCQAMQAKLLTIHDRTFDQHVGKVITESFAHHWPSSQYRVWIGIHMDTRLQTWIWDNQVTHKPTDYNHFYLSYWPRVSNATNASQENCVLKTPDYWVTESCTRSHSYICVSTHPMTSVVG